MTLPIDSIPALLQRFQADVKAAADRRKRQRFEDEAAEFGADLGVDRETSIKLAYKGNSLAQGIRSLGGNALQRQVCDLLDQVVDGAAVVERRFSMPYHKAKPLDGYIATSNGVDWFFTVKRSSRERAEHTWNEECAFAKKYCRERGRECRFVAIVEGKFDAKLRAKLNRSIEYGSVNDYDFLARVIFDLRDDLISEDAA